MRKRNLLYICLIAALVVVTVFGISDINCGPHWTELQGPTIYSSDAAVGETRASLDYIALTLDRNRYSTSIRKITGRLKNKKALAVEYSNPPSLQIMQDGIWYSLKRESHASILIAPTLDAGKTIRVELDLDLYGETLIPGCYRLVIFAQRPGVVGDTGDYISAEFDVVE